MRKPARIFDVPQSSAGEKRAGINRQLLWNADAARAVIRWDAFNLFHTKFQRDHAHEILNNRAGRGIAVRCRARDGANDSIDVRQRHASGATIMWFWVVAAGAVAVVAAISAYLSGYLDGRKDVRAMREKMFKELRDFEWRAAASGRGGLWRGMEKK